MENRSDPNSNKKLSFREWLSLGEVGGYFFRKKDPNRPVNVNIRIMHGINRIAIAVFLLSILFFLAKRFLF